MSLRNASSRARPMTNPQQSPHSIAMAGEVAYSPPINAKPNMVRDRAVSIWLVGGTGVIFFGTLSPKHSFKFKLIPHIVPI